MTLSEGEFAKLHYRKLGLSTRTAAIIWREGVTPAELGEMTNHELLSLRNVGPCAVAEVRRVIPEGPGLSQRCPTCHGTGQVRRRLDASSQGDALLIEEFCDEDD